MTGSTTSTIVGSRAAIPRWVIGIGLLALLVVVGAWSTSTSAQLHNLGFHVRAEENAVVINWVQPAGLGWDRQLRPGDILLSADGVPVSVNDEPAQLEHATTITFRSGTAVLTATSLDNSFTTPVEEATIFIIAGIFALVGIGVFIIAADMVAASILLGDAFVGAIVLELLAPGVAGNPIHIAALYILTVASGANLLLLAMVFPINWLRTRRNQIIAATALLPALMLVLLFMIASTFDSSIYEWLRNVTYVIHSCNILGAVTIIAVDLVRVSPERRTARRAMGIVGLGMLATILPGTVLLIIPHFLGVQNLAPAWVAGLGMIFMPISIGIAITSRQFLGVTRLVRRGLVALIVWLGLIVLISVVVRGLETWGKGHIDLGAENTFLTALLVACAAMLMWPVQSWLRHRIEGVLFRDVYDYQETMHQLSIEIVKRRGLESIAQYVLVRLVDVLDLTWAKITLFTDSGSDEFRQPAARAADPSSTDTIVVDQPVLTQPLVIEQETIGILSAGPKRHDVEHSPDDVTLVSTLTPMIATALQSALLLRRLEEQVDQLVDREQELAALSSQLMQVQEEERRRLALDLHDDPLQRAILLAREISDKSPPLDRARLRSEADEIIAALRAICAGLRPPVLDDFGLVAGLEALVNEARARSELDISLEVEAPNENGFGRLERELETALYRVAQEALNNCVKHASARSVEVTLTRSERRVTMRVSDDGHGVAAGAKSADQETHLGLLGMRERLQPWDGVVKVELDGSNGSTVFVTVPLRASHG